MNSQALLSIFDAAAHQPPTRPYILAEAGVNHEGDLGVAKRLIDEAASAGADGIKFQTYKADRLASKNSPAYWDTSKEAVKNQHELFSKYDQFWKDEFEALAEHCKGVGIDFLSTPFDLESADFLNPLVSVHKISSSDITNLPFIRYVASFGKPILLSVGASRHDEIERALTWITSQDVPVSLLHCVLNYPTERKNAHLSRIRGLKQAFPRIPIGYSDHTMPGNMDVLLIASLLGAKIIEKHFTHDKSLPGNDHYHAMDARDLERLRARLDEVWELLGSPELDYLGNEEAARQNARRSLVAKLHIRSGQQLRSDDLTWKRPGHGIPPFAISDVVGKKALVDIEADTVLTYEMLT